MTGLETKSGRLHNKRMLPGVVLAMRLVVANYLTLSPFFPFVFLVSTSMGVEIVILYDGMTRVCGTRETTESCVRW